MFISALVCGKGLKSTEVTSGFKSIQMSLFAGHKSLFFNPYNDVLESLNYDV